MKLPSALVALLTAAALSSSVVLAGNPPEFPGQPHINGALKHLNAAKEKLATDAPTATAELQAAHSTLGHASKNKGTYQTIAKQLIGEAEMELKKGDTEKAGKKIDDAIAQVTKAGETGNKEK